jgi:hypothetical protein
MISKTTYGFILVSIIAAVVVVSQPEPKELPKVTKVKHIVHRPSGGLRLFMEKMGKAEGLGDYTAVGGAKKTYLGMYQFHLATLRTLGINTTKDEFLNNPTLQDSAMVLYMKDNAHDLRFVIKAYSNKYYGGIFITKSGILAGAHLVGSAGVLAYFYPEKYSYRTTDGNGVHVSQYIKKFANYNLQGI